MGRITRYFGRIVLSVTRGCLLTALIAGVLALATVLLLNHRWPSTADFTLIVVIVILAGAVGGFVALLWRMSHIPDIIEAAEHISEHKSETSK